MSLAKLTVENIMTAKVFSILPTMTVGEAVNIMIGHKISGAPIVNQAGVVISVLSEGDLLKLTASEGFDKKISACLDKLKKPENLLTIKKSDTAVEAYKMFLKHGVHRLIVCDSNGKLQGIVSRSNILKIFVSEAQAKKQDAAS